MHFRCRSRAHGHNAVLVSTRLEVVIDPFDHVHGFGAGIQLGTKGVEFRRHVDIDEVLGFIVDTTRLTQPLGNFS